MFKIIGFVFCLLTAFLFSLERLEALSFPEKGNQAPLFKTADPREGLNPYPSFLHKKATTAFAQASSISSSRQSFHSNRNKFKRAFAQASAISSSSFHTHSAGKSLASAPPFNIEKKIREKKLKKIGLLVSKIPPSGPPQELFSWNKEDLFVPASLAKIATLSALFRFYPSSYRFKTAFVSSASVKDGVLKGDLVLKGGGDPGFVSESLWNLANALTRSRIKTVAGDLLVDDSLYEKDLNAPASERSYHALASPSGFNWNSVHFRIRPGEGLKQPAKVFVDPKNSYIKVLNKIKTTGAKTKIQIQRKAVSAKQELFLAQGTIHLKEKELSFYRNTQNPALHLGHSAISFLKQRGIAVSGQVKKGSCQGSCRILSEWMSRPFPFHAYNLMKFSNNFVSRMLVSHLPLLKGAEKGGLLQGMGFVRSHLKKIGLTKFHLEEPSGLSRKNRFSPKDLHKLLILSSQSFLQPEMLFSYPLAKGEGTLENRFKNLPPRAFVRAKTGSLDGVLGLAGWAGNGDKRFAFVFIFNGSAQKARKAEEFFDETILSLLQ